MSIGEVLNLCKDISENICLIKSLGKDCFEAHEQCNHYGEKTVYFLKVENNKLEIFDTLKVKLEVII